MKQERIKKAQEISKKIIGEYLIEEVDNEDGDFGIITVTQIIISSELSYLDVYVSALKNEESLTKFLSPHAKGIESKLCKNLPLIKIPKVRFRYDSSGKDSFEIYKKIQNLDTNEN